MKPVYLQSILLMERLHRRFLDVVKNELDRQKIMDINNVQTMILYNIQDDNLTVGELTERGYYLGSNVSYNVKKLVENNYLVQIQDPHDKRSFRVFLSEKGKELCQTVDQLFERHVEILNKNDAELRKLAEANITLRALEKLWSEGFGGLYQS